MRITTVMINTANPEKLAEFWKELLCVEENYKVGNFLWLKAADGQPALGFQKVDDAESQPQRIHIDILVDDKAEATEQVKKLGGSLIQEGDINNIVTDPDGNQFCVYTQGEEA